VRYVLLIVGYILLALGLLNLAGALVGAGSASSLSAGIFSIAIAVNVGAFIAPA
jgi:hypothetical protein